VIPVAAAGDRWTLSANPAKTRAPDVTRADIAAALSLEEADLASDPVWVSTGTEQLMVPVRSPAAVERARPDSTRFLGLGSVEPVKAYVFHDEGDASRRVKARFFFGLVMTFPGSTG